MRNIHFIGIGGAGMAPLAEIMLQRGATVSGSDRELSAKTEELAAAGATIHAGHRAEQLPPGADLAVYSSAVPPGNPERLEAARRGIPELRRGEFLARLAADYRRPAAISGSHGKTTVTAMLTHILLRCGLRPGYLIGAAMQDGSPSADAGADNDLFITEVDESDGTHTLIHPALGIVPNLDDDHSWSVGGEEALHRNFRTFAENSGKLLYYGAPLTDRLFAGHPAAVRLELPPSGTAGDRWIGFLKWNAVLAVRAAAEFGVGEEEAWNALDSFSGAARRMRVRFQSEQLTVIEDYAHHPAELASSLGWLRSRYPEHHLRVLFQPHRYARLEKYFPRFTEELKRADSAIVTPVFAAWSETGPVGGRELAASAGARYLEPPWEQVAGEALEPCGSHPLLLAVIGAGDIEQVFRHLPR